MAPVALTEVVTETLAEALTEAQGWSVDAAGQVVLTAAPTMSRAASRAAAAIPHATTSGAHCSLTAPAP